MTQGPPPPLDYAKPPTPPSRNKWWMVALRIVAGMGAGVVSGGFGLGLASATNMTWLLFVPPAIVFGVLLFVSIKYRRFGYVTGLILAPFLAAAALVILLLIMCGPSFKS